MFDYNRGYADDLEASGISDIFRIPKYAYYFYQSQKTPNQDTFSKPMVNIASNWDESSSLAIRVISNADCVELYLNDQLVPEQTHNNKNSFSDALPYPPRVFTCSRFI